MRSLGQCVAGVVDAHRAADMFFCPEVFPAERWMLDESCESRLNGGGVGIGAPSLSPALSDAEKELLPTSSVELSAHLFPFGHGPRVYGGQNIAQMLLRISLARIARNFELMPAKGTDEK